LLETKTPAEVFAVPFLPVRNVDEFVSECIQMISSPGHYLYVSPGRDDVCGLFIIGSVNQIVALEFTGFDIDCDKDGLLVVNVC